MPHSTNPLTAAADAIQGHMPAILAAVLVRFKRDLPPLGVRGIESMSDPVLADHTTTWIAEVATELNARTAPDPAEEAMLSEGKQVYILLADLHGRQRARHEWTEPALAYEYTILSEEVMRVVQRAGPRSRDVADDVTRVATSSREYAIAGLRQARGASESRIP